MVLTAHPMHSFFQPEHLSVDTSSHIPQKYFDDDDNIFDDSILDHSAVDSGLEMSPPMVGSRRDSFAFGSSLFSPKQEDWQPAEMQSLPSINPFADPHSTNPFLRMDHQHRSHQHQQQHQTSHHHAMEPPLGSWPMTASTSAASGIATPMAQYDNLPSDFDAVAATAVFQRGAIQPPFTSMGGIFGSMHGLPTMAANGGATTSDSSVPMQLSSSGASIDTQSGMPKQIPPSSPTLRAHNELRRGDGIRKKNARFDIPSERNLNNIDQLIQQSKDEQEIKELKQQKRLLRNRQAALDSRQRKKQHTERLEDEKKHYTALINDLEQNMERFKLQASDLMQDKQNYEQYIENLNMEKEEMIRQHTIETAELRKKISVLSNHVQVLEGAAAAVTVPNQGSAYASAGAGVAPSSIEPFGDMDGLVMDDTPDSWVQLFPAMSGPEQQQQQQQQQKQQAASDVKSQMQLIPVGRKVNGSETVESALAATEKSGTQGGLLFMLFLVGAFVLSSRQTPSIPRVSEEVRAASATLLENVLKDAGVPQNTPGLDVAAGAAAATSVNANAPVASATPWTQSNSQPLGVESSVLGQLSDQLIQPTEEQSNEQLFSLTAEQYNGLVDYQHLPTADRVASSSTANQGRRNLAEALTNMRGNSKAEVYTRSLLWDQIPSDVVRSFAKMVSEVNTASPRADEEH